MNVGYLQTKSFTLIILKIGLDKPDYFNYPPLIIQDIIVRIVRINYAIF